MLASAGSLLKCNCAFAFDHEDIEILRQQDKDCLGHRANDAGLHIVHHIEDAEGAILEDRVGIQDKQARFHDSCETESRKLARLRREKLLSPFPAWRRSGELVRGDLVRRAEMDFCQLFQDLGPLRSHNFLRRFFHLGRHAPAQSHA